MRAALDVILSPIELESLKRRDLGNTVCVVLDILRATTTMVAALASGARGIVPVAEIDEAVACRRGRPEVLLAGERDGLRIGGDLSGGVDFDLGNSPREFLPQIVRGRTIVMTTTNGTRALRACAGAGQVLACGFVNVGATLAWLREHRPAEIVIVCSGTHEQAALEDVLAAGALCSALSAAFPQDAVADAAWIAAGLYATFEHDLPASTRHSRNGRRLLAIPELRGDVQYCFERDRHALVAAMGKDGVVKVQEPGRG